MIRKHYLRFISFLCNINDRVKTLVDIYGYSIICSSIDVMFLSSTVIGLVVSVNANPGASQDY